MWLPNLGNSIFEEAYQSRAFPIRSCPSLVVPVLAREDLQKFTTTIRKVAGYLEKSGAKNWLDDWLMKAEDICASTSQQIHPCR